MAGYMAHTLTVMVPTGLTGSMTPANLIVDQCTDCGAMVADRAVHNRWHADFTTVQVQTHVGETMSRKFEVELDRLKKISEQKTRTVNGRTVKVIERP